MNSNLEQLASKLKIATTYSDGGLTKKNYTVNDKTIKFCILLALYIHGILYISFKKFLSVSKIHFCKQYFLVS